MQAEMFKAKLDLKYLTVVDACSRSHQRSTRSPKEASCIFSSEKPLQACSLLWGNPNMHNSIERSIKYSILSPFSFVNTSIITSFNRTFDKIQYTYSSLPCQVSDSRKLLFLAASHATLWAQRQKAHIRIWHRDKTFFARIWRSFDQVIEKGDEDSQVWTSEFS